MNETHPDTGATRTGRFRYFGRLSAGYLVSRDWPVAWGMLLVLCGQTITGSFGTMHIVRWQKSLADALTARQASQIGPLIAEFAFWSLVLVAQNLLGGYLQPLLAMRWRRWITDHLKERWLADQRFVAVERQGLVDNPDQRMTEDVTLFTTNTLALVMNAIGVGSSLWLLGRLLYEVSSPIALQWGGWHVSIPGDMLIYSVLYATLGSWIIGWIGRRFIHLTQRQQHVEADFRFRLIHIRRNAEQIAFARATPNEQRDLDQGFAAIFANFKKVQLSNVLIGITRGLYFNFQDIVPLLILLPRYFVGNGLSLGDLMQTRQAFGGFNSQLSWFVQAFGTFATVIAAINRLAALESAMGKPAQAAGIAVATPGADLSIKGLRIDRPNGAPLLGIDAWTVKPGESWCVSGASGTGKSTLLRVLAGIWPYGQGNIALPAPDGVLFLPQRGYMPLGTLREALAYPDAPETLAEQDAVRALNQVGLGDLAPRLGETARWTERLSPGEQQRLAFARVLIKRPAWLILDEATSALDPANATAMFALLREQLPNLTLISVLHDPQLARFHTHRLSVDQGQAHPGPLAA